MRNRGFTLVEAMIVVALTGIMVVVLTQFFLGGNQTYRTQNAELDVNFAARLALDDVDSYVRQANQLLATYDTHTSGPTVLILELTSVNSSNLLVPGALDRVVFYFDEGQLFRQIYADPASARQSSTRRVADDISSLVFTYDNVTYASVTTVDTSITATQVAGRETRTLVTGSKSRLRN